METSDTKDHMETHSQEIDKDEEEDDDIGLNISMESEHLDPAEKAAHEADTLPMDAEQPRSSNMDVHGTQGQPKRFQSLQNLVDKVSAPILVEKNPLPPEPSRKQRLIHCLRCPPHGFLGNFH